MTAGASAAALAAKLALRRAGLRSAGRLFPLTAARRAGLSSTDRMSPLTAVRRAGLCSADRLLPPPLPPSPCAGLHHNNKAAVNSGWLHYHNLQTSRLLVTVSAIAHHHTSSAATLAQHHRSTLNVVQSPERGCAQGPHACRQPPTRVVAPARRSHSGPTARPSRGPPRR